MFVPRTSTIRWIAISIHPSPTLFSRNPPLELRSPQGAASVKLYARISIIRAAPITTYRPLKMHAISPRRFLQPNPFLGLGDKITIYRVSLISTSLGKHGAGRNCVLEEGG